MNIKTIAAGTLAIMLLAGCAGGKKPTVVKGSGGSSLEVLTTLAQTDMNGNHYPDAHLRVVGPGSTGVVAGLTAVGALLGGASISSDMFDKKGYRGTTIDALPEPTSRYFAPKAEAKIAEYLDKNGGSYACSTRLLSARQAGLWSIRIYPPLTAITTSLIALFSISVLRAARCLAPLRWQAASLRRKPRRWPNGRRTIIRK
ncbi:MAG: hypothetical protein E6562_13180 [Pantoea sp.]|uniref:hypothetical protein n=1 Tax=Pantoea sp. TaxID=69393 RepID=UPI002905FD86|nr:hypothetical protein [Pantoea sp.]MDU6389533.1 hypothetical protein [Pantoea sp.]